MFYIVKYSHASKIFTKCMLEQATVQHVLNSQFNLIQLEGAIIAPRVLSLK